MIRVVVLGVLMLVCMTIGRPVTEVMDNTDWAAPEDVPSNRRADEALGGLTTHDSFDSPSLRAPFTPAANPDAWPDTDVSGMRGLPEIMATQHRQLQPLDARFGLDGLGRGFHHGVGQHGPSLAGRTLVQHNNEHFETLIVNSGSWLVLRNCTVGLLIVNAGSAGAVDFLADSSLIGRVVSTSFFFGNTTFVRCEIGDNTTLNAVSFDTGMGLHSTLSFVNTRVFSAGSGVTAGGGLHGVVSFADTNITVKGSTPAYGVRFTGLVGPVNFVRCSVRVSTSSSANAAAMYFQNAVAGIRIESCILETFMNSGQSASSVGLYLDGIASSGCVYVTGGSISARCDAATFGSIIAVLLTSVTGGLMFDGTTITGNGFIRSWGCYIGALGSHSTLLLRSVDITVTSRDRTKTLTQRAFFVLDFLTGATAVFESTTLRASQGACLYLSANAPTPQGIIYIRGLTLAACYRNVVDTSASSAVRFRQNCLELPGPVRTDQPIDRQSPTIVFPCVNNTPRTTPVHVNITTELPLRTCRSLGPVSPFSTTDPHEITLSGRHVNQNYGVVSLNGNTSLFLQNCTLRVLIINGSTEETQLLAVGSTIRYVLSATQFMGNATFVGCVVGGEDSPEAMTFPSGAGPSSVLSVADTVIEAAQNCIHFEDSYGRVSLVNSTITASGRTATYGIMFNRLVYGPVTITRCVVHSSSTSTIGTTAVFFRWLWSGVHITDCNFTAYSDTGRQGNAAGLQVSEINSNACVYVSRGSVLVYSSSTTQAGAYGGLFRSINGGAVMIEGVAITTSSAVSYGFYAQHISATSAVLLRSVNIVTLLHSAKPNRNARAFYVVFGNNFGDAVAVLDNVTMRAPRGVCLFLNSFTPRSGLVDLRGVNFADCHYQFYDARVVGSSVTLQQNCLKVAGKSTEAPIGYPPATTVFPCVNNTPRTTPIDTKATTTRTCAVFGPIRPLRILKSMTLAGNVNRSFEYLGVLVIEDPGNVSLSDVDATGITFTRSVKQQSGLDNSSAGGPTIRITRCRVGTGGIKFTSPFTSVDLVIDGSAITASNPAVSTVPLLSIYAVQRGSIVVRDSEFTGRRMFYTQSILNGSSVDFQRTQFVSPSLGLNTRQPVTHFAFTGEVVRSTITFEGCSLQSHTKEEVPAKAPRIAIGFSSLDRAKVAITHTTTNLMEAPTARFLDVGSYRNSCITIVNSSVTLSCSSHDTSTPNRCPQSDGRSFIFHGASTPASGATNSYLTFDFVNMSMATYSATAVFLPHLQNIDVVMSRINAVLTSAIITTYLFYADDANSAVVALLDSTISVRKAYAYRLGTVDHDVSLLNVGNNFTVLQLMFDTVSRSALNARQGCDESNSNSTSLGGPAPCIVVDHPSSCAATSAVYRALDIDAHKKVIVHPPGDTPSDTDVKVWVIAGVLGAWVLIGLIVLVVFTAMRQWKVKKQRYVLGGGGESDLSVESAAGSSESADRAKCDDERDVDSVLEQYEQNVEMVKLFHHQLQNSSRIHEWLRNVESPAEHSFPVDLAGQTPCCPPQFGMAERVETNDDTTVEHTANIDARIDVNIDIEEDVQERAQDEPRSVAMTVDRFPASLVGDSRVFHCSDNDSQAHAGPLQRGE